MELWNTQEGIDAGVDILIDGLDGIHKNVINTAQGEIAANEAELEDDNGNSDETKLSGKELLAKYS